MFYRDDCIFCQKMMPIVDNMEEIEKVKMGELKMYNISSVPTFIAFDGDKEINRISGMTTKEILLKLFDPKFKPPSNIPERPKERLGLHIGVSTLKIEGRTNVKLEIGINIFFHFYFSTDFALPMCKECKD